MRLGNEDPENVEFEFLLKLVQMVSEIRTTYKTFKHIGEVEEGKPWMIFQKRNKLDFMGINDVTILDVLMLDDNPTQSKNPLAI
ncbi:hypothetical protein C5167_035229 [Papaver somniferum]|uniref:Uncharacterized protein n=1 Tax=Papaver somniferum TaxID=3469 RepID=A0A4Y7KJJ4_PAPSO|nr:hypothetical protein C5167_035229 [Papaver somniferum]